ncbi:HipA domain-containing protein [Niveibacterium sp. SC-1]|uniref:HipA domain-containing protein n=1 Tax=Niveibacterium sp. SC-1 TaxID=3135646 RepID=UPI00311E6AAC
MIGIRQHGLRGPDPRSEIRDRVSPYAINGSKQSRPKVKLPYPILKLQAANQLSDEPLGTKDKYWFGLGRNQEDRWLFKFSRTIKTATGEVVTGEDWAEKVAAEVARQINVRAATVELAEFEGRRGSATLSFLAPHGQHLEHGNEILAGRVLGYDGTRRHRQSAHTIDNIVLAIEKMFRTEELANQVLRILAGYLVLDALICNVDRHHENWGLLWQAQLRDETEEDWERPQLAYAYSVAPSFDHASSLGRELLDERRARILRDGRLESYVARGRGGIYLRSTDKHAANPLRLVDVASRRFPEYFRPSLSRLADTPLDSIKEVIDPVPSSRITNLGRDFARALLGFTYEELARLAR